MILESQNILNIILCRKCKKFYEKAKGVLPRPGPIVSNFSVGNKLLTMENVQFRYPNYSDCPVYAFYFKNTSF